MADRPSEVPPEGARPSRPSVDDVPLRERLRRGLQIHWRLVVLIAWPFVAALVFIGGTGTDLRCTYVVLLMAIYWVCEVLPLGITSLIPIVLFPVLSVLDTNTTCWSYLNNTTMLFMCSLFIAFAIESSNLHRRIALKVILLIGTTHLRLTLGFMMVTMFVSMWIVNTAATAMMAPVVLAVLTALEESDLVRVYHPLDPEADEDEIPYPSRTTICYFCCIAYSSTIGGIGTMIGTGTNLTFVGLFEGKFPKAEKIDFGKWLVCWAPMMLIMNVGTWAGLNWQFLGLFNKRGMDEEVKKLKSEDKEQYKKTEAIAKDIVKLRYEELGPFTWAEGWVATLFILVLVLWITEDPTWTTGWAPSITHLAVKDATPAVLIVILLFAIPMTTGVFYCLSKDPEKRPVKQEGGILTWDLVKVKMMWGLLFLLGSGFALSKGSDKSGMSKMLGNGLSSLKVLHPWIVLFIVCFIASMATEFTSNVAVCNILVPVVTEMAIAIKVNPIFLTLPTAICCSFSFMLPVGTPPNALVAGYVNIRTKDLILAGIFPTIFTLLVIVTIFPFYGEIFYPNLMSFPDWAVPE